MTRNIIIFGPPGCGKGTQSQFIMKDLGLIQMSTGDMLRENVANKTKIGKVIKDIMSRGELVSNDIINELIDNFISSHKDSGLLLDGYPRTRDQAENLDHILKKYDMQIDVILNLQIDFSILFDRITKRYFCKNCNMVYNELYNPPQKEGVCNRCGHTEMLYRKDDTQEVVSKRLEVYTDTTEAILEYYRNKISIEDIEANQPIEKVYEDILKVIS